MNETCDRCGPAVCAAYRVDRSGELYLTHTKLDGKLTLRLCVGQTNTQERHVERAWRRIREEAEKAAALP